MYLVIEIQNNGEVSTITTSHATLNEAYNKYYLVLSAAAISNVTIHSAILMSDHGEVISAECFEH